MTCPWQLFVIINLLLLSCIQADDNNNNSNSWSEHSIPDEYWETANIWDLFDRLQCQEVHLNPENPNAFPVHGTEVWNLLRKAYRETLGNESSIPPAEEDDREPTDGTKGHTGFLVGTQVLVSEELGRGNYATEDIKKGTMVWKSKYTARFTTGNQYRAFLKAIPPALACEIIIWAYTRFDPSGNIVACVDLEPGCFTNHASTPDKLTMQVGTEENTFENSGCDLELYAPRDIAKGEALLMDYDFSERHDGWAAMGLARPRVQHRYEGENEEEDEDEGDEEGDDDDDDDEEEEL